MLDLLNNLLLRPVSADTDRILWHDLKHASEKRLGELHGDISSLRQKIGRHAAKRWLLYSESPDRFLVGLLVLLALGKQVLICANKKPEWLGMLADEFDAILSDEYLSVTTGCSDIPVGARIDFEQDEEFSLDWGAVLSGNEELVFYTSGSTGQPKAIHKTLRAFTNEIDTLLQVFSSQVRGGTFVSSVSHLHIYGLLFRVLLPLAANGSAVIQQIEFPEQLLFVVARLHGSGTGAGTVFISSPAFLGRLDTSLPGVPMAAVFSSGGPLSFEAAGASGRYLSTTPIEVYGSTETGGIGYRQQETEATPWTLFPELLLSVTETGVGLMTPHMPGLPRYDLDDDLEILAADQFILKGRKDRIVKIAEKRVSLTEIEKFLEGLDSIQQCVALPLVLKREMVVCAVVLTAEGRNLLAALGQQALVSNWKKAMRRRFDNVTIPRKWQIVAGIPLTSQSKIDNALLLAGFTGNAD